MPEHVRAVMARWQRFEELKSSAATLQRLESTTDLIYFDFRPDTGTFRPSAQMRQILGLTPSLDPMAPGSLLDRMHSDDRALFAGHAVRGRPLRHALLRPDPTHGCRRIPEAFSYAGASL